MQLTKNWAGQLDDYVIDLAWAPDGSQLAAASAAGPVTLFAAADGTKQHVLPGHADGTNCLAWQPSGHRSAGATSAPAASGNSAVPITATLATGGQDGAVKFWDATTGQHVATASLGSAWVEHLAWRPRDSGSRSEDTPPSRLLFAAAGKSLVALRPDASVAHTFKPAPKTISAMAFQPAGGCIAVAYFGGVCLWDADDFVAQK
jgi:WD40 repeat protein